MPEDIRIPVLSGGVNQGSPRDLIPVTQATNAQNIMFKDGVPQKRTGYAEETGASLTGTPFLLGYHYQDGLAGNSKAFWGFTGGGAFCKTELGGAWTSKTNSMAIQSGLNQYFTVTEIVEFNNYHNYLIVCQNHTNPTTALNGTVGGSESLVWYAQTPTSNLAALVGADGYNDSNIYHRAKQAIAFGDHLLLLNTYEEYAASTWGNFFFRIRWCQAAEFLTAADWDDTNTEGAGYHDLLTKHGGIVCCEYLANGLAIYLQNAIYMCYNTKSVTRPFEFWPKVSGVGPLGPRYVIAVRDRHYFVGNDNNIYAYYGGRDLVSIGDQVKTEFFGSLNKTVTSGYRICDRGFGIHFRDMNCIGWAVPTGSSTVPDTLYVYDYVDNKWLGKWSLADVMTGWGEWKMPSSSTAMNLPVLGDNTATNAKVYQFDYSQTNDDGGAIDAYIETKDFVINLKSEYQVCKVFFDAKGSSTNSALTVQASLDGGQTWLGAVEKTLTVKWNAYTTHFNVTGYMVRFKFSDDTSGKRPFIGQIRVEFEDNTDTDD